MTIGAARMGEAARMGGGTRFRLFAQPALLAGYREPITVELSPRAGSLGPGPCDARMAVIRPIGKQLSYGEGLLRGRGHGLRPPWRGPLAAPALPDAAGHFDHLPVDDPAFAQAHAYACVRLALDVWERYLGVTVPWYFGASQRWLEIGLLGEAYQNGEVGWGWLELGYDLADDRPPLAFALHLDIIAHEVGHLIVYGLLGEPDPARMTAEYAGFHEAAADLVALLVAAQLDPVLDRSLHRTRGNLYGANELNRLGELSATTQIRIADNSATMSEFALGWSDEHELSEPFTGAVFDLLLDIYQAHLVARGLIPRSLADMVVEVGHLRSFAPIIQAEFDRHYPKAPAAFRAALVDARDRLGHLLAQMLHRLAGHPVTYVAARDTLLAAERAMGSTFAEAIMDNFAWRRIGAVPVGPYLGAHHEAATGARLGLHRCAKRVAAPAKG